MSFWDSRETAFLLGTRLSAFCNLFANCHFSYFWFIFNVYINRYVIIKNVHSGRHSPRTKNQQIVKLSITCLRIYSINYVYLFLIQHPYSTECSIETFIVHDLELFSYRHMDQSWSDETPQLVPCREDPGKLNLLGTKGSISGVAPQEL